MKKKPVIKIKKKNEGKFTKYCKNKGYKGVTKECINKAKKSKNPITKKRAIFADNARKWKKK